MDEKPSELVLSQVEGNIGNILLNRPKYLNAFNHCLAEGFLRAMRSLEDESSVRAIVIRGVGSVFSAGGDVKEMLRDVSRGKDRAAYFRTPLAAFNEMAMRVRNIHKPVLVAVHGAVAGVAFNLMLACDLRIAEEHTRFSQAFIKLGLSPDGGGTYHLPRLVGYARACELTMLPTQIDAQTALQWGLVNWIVPAHEFDEKIKSVAKSLVDGPASAISRTKKLLNQSHDNTLPEHMELERLAQVENAAEDDFEEGLRAFVEKRQPVFHSSKGK